MSVTDPFWTEEDIAALKAAILQSGAVLTVSYEGPPRRTVTYRSLSEMRSLLIEMTRVVLGPTTFRRVAWRKGFDGGGDE